ncbi:hypothetical protein Bhyg_07220 [Pseudolycoriella hygida]|uniref:Uncharacterized protein n=1 Tax=Pseudolycoriella hygida TaxID=35572 RepID=A0A9Q0N289_9DIPT|nr:hypothetical protein Bhyg_07220 [Pseudolycoriella hygida]
MRSTMNKCLPHSHTIAAWYRVINGDPGFTVESLNALTELQKNTPHQIIFRLVLDGMAILIEETELSKRNHKIIELNCLNRCLRV